jgi:hypothetical protein
MTLDEAIEILSEARAELGGSYEIPLHEDDLFGMIHGA